MTIQALAFLLTTLGGAEGRIEGSVTFVGEPPERRAYELDEAMRALHGADVFHDEEWLVGEKGELANVVLTFHALDVKDPPRPKPVTDAVYEKRGPRYEPRILVVPVDSEVTLRNVNSPCNGFMSRGRRTQFNVMLAKGAERKLELEHRGVIPITCDVRPMMRGAIVVVDTPWYAKTASDGRFAISAIPPGRYRLEVWHEALGRIGAPLPATVTVAPGEPVRLELEIPSPRAKAAPAGG